MLTPQYISQYTNELRLLVIVQLLAKRGTARFTRPFSMGFTTAELDFLRELGRLVLLVAKFASLRIAVLLVGLASFSQSNAPFSPDSKSS